MTAGAPPRFAAVVSFFPTPYEHFLYRELAGLVRQGFDLELFATRGAMETPPSDDVALLAARARHPGASLGRLAGAQLWAISRHPVRTLAALATVLRGHGASPRAFALGLFSFAIGVAVARAVAASERALVVGEWANHPATVAFVAARIAGARFAFVAHAGDVFLYPDPFLPAKARAAEAIVTCTAEGAEALSAMAPGVPVFVVHHGLSEDWFAPRATPLGTPPKLLLVGRLEGSKGEDVVLRALALLRERGLVLPLTLVGAGPRFAATVALARELGLEAQVRFEGALPPAEVRRLYDTHDVLVMPARRETHYGIPNVLVEAMARGLASIVSPLPSVARIVRDGEEALLVPQDDAPAVARALERVLAAPEEARAIGRRAQERARQLFRLERSLAALGAILRDPAAARADRAAEPPLAAQARRAGG